MCARDTSGTRRRLLLMKSYQNFVLDLHTGFSVFVDICTLHVTPKCKTLDTSCLDLYQPQLAQFHIMRLGYSITLQLRTANRHPLRSRFAWPSSFRYFTPHLDFRFYNNLEWLVYNLTTSHSRKNVHQHGTCCKQRPLKWSVPSLWRPWPSGVMGRPSDSIIRLVWNKSLTVGTFKNNSLQVR